MHSIDDQLSHEEIDYLFGKFDADGDNTLDFNEFSNWLEMHHVRMSLEEKD